MFEDLERAFDGLALEPHVDYKIWADSYYFLRDSKLARNAVDYHVVRLSRLSEHRKALYPKMPRRDRQGMHAEGGQDCISALIKVCGLAQFRRRYKHISAPVIVKAALALVNIHRTGCSHALFANLQAARDRWPFVPKVLEQLGSFECADIAGPTIQVVVNLIELRRHESVVAFLTRMQEDQDKLTRHASAPLQEIIDRLEPEAGVMVREVVERQLFNWVPQMGAAYEKGRVRNVDMVARPKIGLSLNMSLDGEDEEAIQLQLRGDSNERAGWPVPGIDIELGSVLNWLTNPANEDRDVTCFKEILCETLV